MAIFGVFYEGIVRQIVDIDFLILHIPMINIINARINKQKSLDHILAHDLYGGF